MMNSSSSHQTIEKEKKTTLQAVAVAAAAPAPAPAPGSVGSGRAPVRGSAPRAARVSSSAAVPVPVSPTPHYTHYTDSFGDTYTFTDEELGYTPIVIEPDMDSASIKDLQQHQKDARLSRAQQEALRRGYRKRTGMEFPTQPSVVLDVTEADRGSLLTLDNSHHLSPCCIIPDYVYNSADELKLIAPTHDYKTAERDDNDEKLVLERSGQQLGRVWKPRPELGPGTGFTEADRQRHLDTWHSQGWWFSIVPDDRRAAFPHRAGWRTFPCVGLLMELDPACPMVQSQQASQLQQQQQQERQNYLKYIMETKGYEGFVKEMEEEKKDPRQYQQRQQQFTKSKTTSTTSSTLSS